MNWASCIWIFETHTSIEVVNSSIVYLFCLTYLLNVIKQPFVQFDSKIPASVFITLDQYISIKYFEPKISKKFKIEVDSKFVTLKNSNSVYLQFVCGDYSQRRGYTFYAISQNDSKNGYVDRIRINRLRKRIKSENKGTVLEM